MTTIHDEIELLRAELRGCIDPGERIQIRAELDAAMRRAEAEQSGEPTDAILFDPPPG